MRRMTRRSAWVEIAASVVLGASLALGCAQLFGIDAACSIEEAGCGAGAGGEASGGSAGSVASANGGASGSAMRGSPGNSAGGSPVPTCAPDEAGCAPDVDLCSQYCTEISAKCSASSQYDFEGPGDRPTECTSLCKFIPLDEGQGVGNTLQCRLDRLSAERVERTDCFVAGRGGDLMGSVEENSCGSKCEAYCSFMATLCVPQFERFEDRDACLDECGRLDDRQDYDPALDGPDMQGATIQCRLWHLGAAAIEVAKGSDPATHCGHADGNNPCLPPPR